MTTPNTRSANPGEQLSFLPPAPFCPAWPTKHTLDWVRWFIDREPSRWYVCGLVPFTSNGFAVINDFGDLVAVPK